VNDPTRQEVTMPFVKRKVPVDVDFKNHPAIQSLGKWGPKLKTQIEEACFANYQNKVASLGPETLPKIRQPSHVWKHMNVQSVRIDPTVMDRLVVYVVPDWDEDEHLEWCIEGAEKLVYVGQFLGLPVHGY
jgi:Domain of unknown function (DUF6985)